MSDQVQTQVDELLTAVNDASTAAVASETDTGGSDAGSSISETAQEASELVASTDPQELLAAIGLGTLPDGSESETIPEAIARGDPKRVDDLKRLLTLSKLADRDEGELETAADTLGEVIDTEPTAEPREDGSVSADEGQEQEQEPEPEAETDDREEPAETSEDEASDDLESKLRSTLSDRVEQFGDDVSGLQEQLGSVATSATGVTGEESDEAEQTAAQDDDADEPEAEDDLFGLDQDAEDTAAEGDDDLFGLGRDDDQTGSIGSSDSSRHSTMAPPPSDRADMRAVKRHSTMPGKD